MKKSAKKKNPVLAYLAKIGKKGGKASVAGRSPEARKALAELGARSRWNDHEYSNQPDAVYQRARRAKLKQRKETEQP